MDRRRISDGGQRRGHSRKPPEWSFGQWLRHLRKARKWSQASLARRMVETATLYQGAAKRHVSQPMISKWESNRTVPGQYNRHLLAATLGIHVAELGLPVDPDFAFAPK